MRLCIDNENIVSNILGGVEVLPDEGNVKKWKKVFNYADFAEYKTYTRPFTLTVTDSSNNSDDETINITVTKSDDENPVITSFVAKNGQTQGSELAVSVYSSSKTTVNYTAEMNDILNYYGGYQTQQALCYGNTYTWSIFIMTIFHHMALPVLQEH